jgi:hypothetical protein
MVLRRVVMPVFTAREAVQMVEPGMVFTGVSTVSSVLKTLDGLIKGTRGRKRAILLEMRGNVRLIGLSIEGDLPIDKVVEKLEIKQLEAALQSDFKFSTLKKGKIKKSAAKGVAQFKKYVGWTTEDLVSSIYLRIKDLKNIVEIDPDNKKIRKSVRLRNIGKLIVLLMRHIRS